jgi:hypothetical protein
MPATPFVQPKPLRFRGVSDALAKYHVEGSECCLIHADNPLTVQQGVYVNPRVRVGYSVQTYDLTHNDSWLSSWDVFYGLWANRFRRWLTSPMFKEWVIRWRVKEWESVHKPERKERGTHCLINEMQVVVYNGWAHV